MRKFSLITLLLTGLLMGGCSKLPDELFVKSAVITINGFQDWNLKYSGQDTITSSLPISVSGTSTLKNDVSLTLAVDADTLALYNFEKYRKDSISYYEILPDSCYTIKSLDVVIKAGTEYSTLPVTFNLNKIDKYKNYVLPLKIVSVTGCSIGAPRYSTILMNIKLTNDYAGEFATNAKLIDNVDKISGRDTLIITDNTSLRAINNETSSLFAGVVTSSRKDRVRYIMNVKFQSDSTLVLTAKDPSIALVPEKSNKSTRINIYQVTVTPDPKNNNKATKLTKIYLKYKFKDFTNPLFPTIRQFDGYLLNIKTIYYN